MLLFFSSRRRHTRFDCDWSSDVCSSDLGIPLTHRRLASSFAVVTGHEDATRRAPHVDWSRLATAVDTLVILMGARSLPRIEIGRASCREECRSRGAAYQ